jgi:hypothetical protein
MLAALMRRLGFAALGAIAILTTIGGWQPMPARAGVMLQAYYQQMGGMGVPCAADPGSNGEGVLVGPPCAAGSGPPQSRVHGRVAPCRA